jgi:hypothetical protein
MKLATLDIDPAEAARKLAEYEAAIATERNAEDEAIAAGYRAASRGLGVISLPATIAAGGFHDSGLPRIAIARADTQICYCYWDWTDLIFGERDDWRVNRGALVGASSVRVRVADPPQNRPGLWSRRSAAPVPIVPPNHRPRRPRRLSRCHVLWEVEEWKPVAPRDPALLRHIRGSLWAVLSVWDLTELERLVLSQRFA